MTTLMLILMALLLVAALERTHRRQPPHPPGLYGARDNNDRDWARTQLDLLVLSGRSELGHQRPQWSSRRSPRRPNDGRLEVEARMPARSGQRVTGITSS